MTAVPLNGDVLLKDTSLLVNNTFDVDALVKTLERYAVQNYSDLYHVQRTKVGIESFTLDFSEFKNVDTDRPNYKHTQNDILLTSDIRSYRQLTDTRIGDLNYIIKIWIRRQLVRTQFFFHGTL